MPSVVRVSREHFPEIHAELLRPLNPDMPVAAWRRAFEHRGWSSEECTGFALALRGRFIGLLGALFSDREVDGRRQRYCNLHSWYVLPEHRGPSSLVLLRAVLELPDTVLTDFSASAEVAGMLERIGFHCLGTGLTVLPALPFAGVGVAPAIDLESSPDAAARILSPGDLRIFRDHHGIDCRHLVAQEPGGEYCYVVASRPHGGPLAHVHVHYVSRPKLLARRHLAFRKALFADGARYAAIPTRLLRDERLPLSFQARGGRTMCRPAVPPSTIDSLYSEMALLKLPVVPQAPAWLRNGRRVAARLLRRH